MEKGCIRMPGKKGLNCSPDFWTSGSSQQRYLKRETGGDKHERGAISRHTEPTTDTVGGMMSRGWRSRGYM